MVYFVFVFLTVISTVSSQIVFKLGVRAIESGGDSLFSISTLLNPYIFSGLLLSVISILSWLVALSKLNLSVAYPFMSLTFPLVLICSAFFLNEPVSLGRWVGISFILFGLFVIGRFS